MNSRKHCGIHYHVQNSHTITRRAALSGLAVAAQGFGAKAENCIDAHVHVWTPDIVRFPRPRPSGAPVVPVSFTPEQLLAIARPAGVTRIVLIQMSFYLCVVKSSFPTFSSICTRIIEGKPRSLTLIRPVAFNKAGQVN